MLPPHLVREAEGDLRAVFIGASTTAVMTTRLLLERGHEVVIIERDEARIEALSPELDCGFIHGDGSKPAILKEVNPEPGDVLFCLTENDQTNIIAALLGQSLGFGRVIPKIQDPEFEHLCIELGLQDTIIPAQAIARHLADMFEGQSLLELSGIIRGDARVFSFVVPEGMEGPIEALDLPKESRVIALYRQGDFMLPGEDTVLRKDDEVVLITHRRHLPELRERFGKASPR